MRPRRILPTAVMAGVLWLVGCSDGPLVEPSQQDLQAPQLSEQRPVEVIPGQYIVVFKDDVKEPVQLALQMAASQGLTLRHTYQHAIKGFSAVVPEGRVQALEQHPMVQYVEQNTYMYIDTHERLRMNAAATESRSRAATLVMGLLSAPLNMVAPFRAPANLTATAVSSSQIDVTWTESNSDEAGHEVHRANDPGGPFALVADLGPNATFYADSSLSASTQYCYKVRAYKFNKRGKVRYTDFSNTDCATTPGPPTPPAAPSDLVANAVSSSQIDLTWTDNANNEDNFELERCAGAGCTTFANIANPPANSTSYADSGLAASTVYRYRIRACNAAGCSGYSNIAEDQTPAPPAPPDGDPTDLVATAVSSSQIDLTWTDNATNEDGYQIWRCTGTALACNDADYTQVDQTGPFVGSGSYSDMGLSPSTTYSYKVRAFNVAGVSAFSNEADATTQEAAGCADNGVHDDLSDPGLWGIVKVKAAQNAHWQGVRGNGPECAMQAWFFGLDTGVDSDHPDLNVVETQTFLTGDTSGGEDGHGHGTHTAGTAAAIDGGPAGGVVGVAPGAQIYGFKVCTDGGSCPLDAIIAGVDEVTARKNANPSQPMVANMSLGGGASTSIDQAVRRSVSAGVVYTLSAGNGVFGACLFPADAQNSSPARVGDDDIVGQDSNGDTRRVNGAVTTTSSGQTDADVNCNFGNPVTVASPGNGIKSTWLNGGYNTISGTSMAAPHSAGGAILYFQGNLGATPTQVEQAIVNDLDNWTTDDLPNADGRLDARCLGTADTTCVGNN